MTTPRTTLKRRPERGHYAQADVFAVLDATLIGHLSTVVDGAPRVLPTAVWRVGNEAIVHGARKNGLLAALAEGAPFALAMTLVDGLVLARSAFHHSLNYRSLVAFGTARVLDDVEEKQKASVAFLEKLCRGRSEVARAPTDAELKATIFCALPLNEASVKIREGDVKDDSKDLDFPCWAGVIPISTRFGEAEPAPGLDPALVKPSGPFCI